MGHSCFKIRHPLDLLSLTLEQGFPCDGGSTAPIADVSLPLCEFSLCLR
jgi:hypothetical protein